LTLKCNRKTFITEPKDDNDGRWAFNFRGADNCNSQEARRGHKCHPVCTTYHLKYGFGCPAVLEALKFSIRERKFARTYQPHLGFARSHDMINRYGEIRQNLSTDTADQEN